MTRTALPPLSILVVDDYPDTTESSSFLLRAEGHDVRTAGTGRDALSLLDGWQPAVVLLDLIMPEMDGFQVAERIRDGCGERPLLVAVSGSTGAAHRDRARAAGFNHFFAKPVDPEALSVVVRAHALNLSADAARSASQALGATTAALRADAARILARYDQLSAAAGDMLNRPRPD